MLRPLLKLAFVLAIAALFVGCGDNNGDAESNSENNVEEEPEPFSEDCTAMVVPSNDASENRNNLGTALAEAEEGAVICIGEGEYPLDRQLTLNATDLSDVEIRGESQTSTVLDFEEQDGSNGILVEGIDDFRATNFTIQNTAGDAIKVHQDADGVEFIDMTVNWEGDPSTDNGAYGIYPVNTFNVLIEGCTVRGASDAGIYVGQTDTAIVRNNEVYENVAGIEIENTSNAEVHDNDVYNNTGGILVFNLPDLEVRDGSHNKIHSNTVTDNNHENFAESGTTVSDVPSGTGMLLISTDRNEIHDNVIEDHNSIGIAITSYLTLEQNVDDEEFEAYSEANFVHNNSFANIGQDPQGIAAALASQATEDGVMPELVIDGQLDPEPEEGTTFEDIRDCFDANQAGDDDAGFLNFNFASHDEPPVAATDCSDDWTDFCHYQCTRESLPEVELE